MTMRHALPWPRVAAAWALCALAGCTGPGGAKPGHESPGVQLYEQHNYPAALEYFRERRQRPHVDYALQSLRLASSAMAAGDWAAAQAALEDATRIMDSYHTNTGLQRWVAYTTDETVKVFKGEPYERAMAHYYLGLLYYAKGDYANAGAALRNALFKLKVYDEEHDIESDDSAESEFAIAWYLLARCRQRLNDPGNAARCFGYAAEPLGPAYKWAAGRELNRKANVVVVVETGRGPYKTPYGPNACIAHLNPIFASTPLLPEVWVDGKRVRDPAMLVNLRHISAKRKWQTLDTVRYVKGILSSGAAVARIQRMGALPTAVASLLDRALLPGVRYDIRYWELLPNTLFVLPLELEPGDHALRIIYRDTRGSEHPWHRQEWQRVAVPAEGERLLWIHCGPKIKADQL